MSDKAAYAKYGGGGGEEEAKMETEELNENNDQGTQGSSEEKNDGENNVNVTITTPTKVEDGGTIRVEEVQGQEDTTTNDNEQKQQQGQEHNLAPPRRDTFRRYSNTNTRMWHLLGNDDPEANNEDNTDWQQVTGYQNRRQLRAGVDPNNDERRTRLSTELYPDVFLRDLA